MQIEITMPTDMYPAIQRSIRLPGRGNPGKNCGNEVLYRCDCCGKEILTESSCMCRDCPKCWEKWAAREACIMRARTHDMGKRLHHVVISFDNNPKECDIDDNWIRERRQAVYRVLGEAGIDGGCVVFHPYRERKPGSGEYNRWSPHFHAVVSGRWILRGDEVRERFPDVVFKRVGRVDMSFKRYYYLLHHCGWRGSMEAITWFGCMARNRGQGPQEIEERAAGSGKSCPDCGGSLSVWTYDWLEEDYYWRKPRVKIPG